MWIECDYNRLSKLIIEQYDSNRDIVNKLFIGTYQVMQYLELIRSKYPTNLLPMDQLNVSRILSMEKLDRSDDGSYLYPCQGGDIMIPACIDDYGLCVRCDGINTIFINEKSSCGILYVLVHELAHCCQKDMMVNMSEVYADITAHAVCVALRENQKPHEIVLETIEYVNGILRDDDFDEKMRQYFHG
jgi:hypothetical protein